MMPAFRYCKENNSRCQLSELPGSLLNSVKSLGVER